MVFLIPLFFCQLRVLLLDKSPWPQEVAWTTSATVGIALVGIGTALGINPGNDCRSVISGAISEIKCPPLSRLPPIWHRAWQGQICFTWQYKNIWPLQLFLQYYNPNSFYDISFNIETSGSADVSALLGLLIVPLNIRPVFIYCAPGVVIALILFKNKAHLLPWETGVALAGVFLPVFKQKYFLGGKNPPPPFFFRFSQKKIWVFLNRGFIFF